MQRRGAVILFCAALAGCAAPVAPPAPAFGDTAARQAWKDCGGQALELRRTALTTMRPYRREVWTLARCQESGATVGPYYYRDGP